MSKSKPKVVVIGGGTGLPVLLKGLKNYPMHLTALVTVADDGGSTGGIRKKFSIPAPGDIRNVIIALSEANPQLLDLFQYRFKTSNGLSGHSLGNLLLAALTEVKGSFFEGIKELSEVFQVKGKIYPMTNESISLQAEMEDGTIINGESKIPLANKKINRVFLGPKAPKPIPEVIDAIVQANYIIISPGSLYTSILPNLIMPQIKDAFLQTKAHTLYVCNIMTQAGETTKYTASDHVQAIHDHVGARIVHSILVNNGPIHKEIIKSYRREKAEPVYNDYSRLEKLGLNIIAENIVDESYGIVRHNTDKVAYAIDQLVNP